MKKIWYSCFAFFSWATIAHAQSFSVDEIEAMTRVLRTYALVSAIIVALATSLIVFKNAHKMKGGVFGKVLNYFGVGMVTVLLGFIVNIYPGVVEMIDKSGVTSNILFIIGYIFMAIAASKLSHAIEG